MSEPDEILKLHRRIDRIFGGDGKQVNLLERIERLEHRHDALNRVSVSHGHFNGLRTKVERLAGEYGKSPIPESTYGVTIEVTRDTWCKLGKLSDGLSGCSLGEVIEYLMKYRLDRPSPHEGTTAPLYKEDASE